MSENETAAPSAGERVAIGITFGNSNSSIAYTIDDKAEVIANEDGGGYFFCFFFLVPSFSLLLSLRHCNSLQSAD